MPLAINVGQNRTSVSLLIACRENHPASCAGTVQLELAGEVVSPELAFSGPNRRRYPLMTEADRPLPPQAERNRPWCGSGRATTGAPKNDAFPASMLLSASFLF